MCAKVVLRAHTLLPLAQARALRVSQASLRLRWAPRPRTRAHPVLKANTQRKPGQLCARRALQGGLLQPTEQLRPTPVTSVLQAKRLLRLQAFVLHATQGNTHRT